VLRTLLRMLLHTARKRRGTIMAFWVGVILGWAAYLAMRLFGGH